METLRTLAASGPIVPIEAWLLILLPAALALSCRTQPHAEKAVEPTPTPSAAVRLNPIAVPTGVLGKPYSGTGVVRFISRKEGWVEIEHDEIKGLMPAMTMEYWVRNPSILKGARVGDKVEFVVVEDRKGQYVTKLKRVAPAR